MSHYKSNLRDIEFNLFEVLGRDEVLGTGPFAEVDGETAREVLAEHSYSDDEIDQLISDGAVMAA